MPDIASLLGGLLGNALPQAGDLFTQLGQNAIGGPQAVQQAAENARQARELAQQLNLHNTMTPYEQAQIALQSNAQDTKDAVAVQARDQQGKDLFDMIQKGGKIVPAGTPGAIPYGDYNILPGVATPAKPTYKITPDSPEGKALGLSQPISVEGDKYADIMEKLGTARDKASEKAATQATLQAQADSLHKQIDQRFDPSYYRSLYGGAVDPQWQMHRDAMHEALNGAVATDKKQGNTSQFDQFARNFQSYQSPWEKMQEKKADRDAQYAQADMMKNVTEGQQSYQFHTKELDSLGKPYNDALVRVGRLKDTINSGTIQGDALTPAELMIVMAGGQGAGLRINQSEINQTLGGRNQADELRAALGKWKPGDSAFILPPQQKAQMMKLVNLVEDKLQKRVGIINEAQGRVVNSQTPMTHRQALLDAKLKLAQVDKADADGAASARDDEKKKLTQFPGVGGPK